MEKENTYYMLYQNMENGVYNEIVRTWEKNLAPGSEISVRLVKKDCKKHNVEFEKLIKYAKYKKQQEEQ